MTPSASRVPGRAAAYVAVVGPNDADAEAEDVRLAREVGYQLARHDAILVCGGLKGVMEAASRGVADFNDQHRDDAGFAERLAVGLLPDRDRVEANRYVSVALPTGLDELRNGLIVAVSDAVIAVGCSWGTLSEIALAMRTGKPTAVIAGRGWDIGYRHNLPTRIPTSAPTPEAAVNAIMDELAVKSHKRS